MIGKSTTRTRLCPYCANSIEEEAKKCSYCKSDLTSEFVPPWLNRSEPSSEPRLRSNPNKKSLISSKFIWPVAMFIVALFAFFAGGYIQRSEISLLSQASSRQLQAKDQMIQSQEAQLAQMRKQLDDNSNQLAEMKTKLDEGQKQLSAARQRTAVANREAEHLSASRSAPVRRTAARTPDAASSSPAPARRTVEPGVYETIQNTSVYEDPSSTSRVISQIAKGTRLNVVYAAGDWLEVRSRHGNPPGYVRSDDARQVSRAN